MELQLQPTHMWWWEVKWEGRRKGSETQTQHNVFFLRNFIKAPVPVTSPSSNASSFALNQSWLVVVLHIFRDLQAYCFWCCKGKSWGLVSGLWDQGGWWSLQLLFCTLRYRRKVCMEDKTVNVGSNIQTGAFKGMHQWVDNLYSLPNELKLNYSNTLFIYHPTFILASCISMFSQSISYKCPTQILAILIYHKIEHSPCIFPGQIICDLISGYNHDLFLSLFLVLISVQMILASFLFVEPIKYSHTHGYWHCFLFLTKWKALYTRIFVAHFFIVLKFDFFPPSNTLMILPWMKFFFLSLYDIEVLKITLAYVRP